jgi:hypothetical protein
MAFTLSSVAQVHVDMSPAAREPGRSGLLRRDENWGSGPLFEEPLEYLNVERIEGPEAYRFPGPDDPPAKRVRRGSGGVW